MKKLGALRRARPIPAEGWLVLAAWPNRVRLFAPRSYLLLESSVRAVEMGGNAHWVPGKSCVAMKCESGVA